MSFKGKDIQKNVQGGDKMAQDKNCGFVETSFLQYVKMKQPVIQQALEGALVDPPNTQAKSLLDAMRYALYGPGKRIRMILVLVSCSMFGGRDEDAIPTALGIEMIHTMSLVHDDLPLMDNDDLRRGRATTHKVFGEQVAILAGDALLAEAFGYIARNSRSVNPSIVLEVIARISKAASYDGLAGGQVRDLECEHIFEGLIMADLEWMHIRKTAVLLNAAVACGALLGGASSEDVARLEQYANYIGLAYQVIDDILDVTGETEILGKTVGKDAQAQKITYPRLLGLQQSQEFAETLITKAKDCIRCYGRRAELLMSIADFIIARQS